MLGAALLRFPIPARVPCGHGETVLVVEDNEGVRNVVRELLLRDGYRVLATGSPDEALRLMRDLREGPALVISDVVMPVMSGHESGRRVATQTTNPARAVHFGLLGFRRGQQRSRRRISSCSKSHSTYKPCGSPCAGSSRKRAR